MSAEPRPQSFEQLYTGSVADFPDERRAEVERQLFLLAGRGRLISRALTSFYVSLGDLEMECALKLRELYQGRLPKA